MAALKKLASQTAIYGLSSMVGRLLNYLLVPLYTRIFLPAEYGVVTELYAYASFLAIVFTYGMETAFFRHYESEINKKQVFATAMQTLLFTSIILCGSIALFSGQIANLLDYQQHPEFITYFALILASDAICAVPFARLRAENKAFRFALIKFINILIFIGLNLFFLVLCPFLLTSENSSLKEFAQSVYSPEIGVGYVFFSNVLANLITLALLSPQFKESFVQADFRLRKKMLFYALPLLVAGLAGMVNETMDRIMLKHLLPANVDALSEVGIYGACYKLSILMTLFIQMFRYAAEPFFFSQAKNEDSKSINATVMKYFVLTCLAIFLGVTLFIDLFKYFIGEKYHEGLKIVPILLLANMCLGIFFNLSIWYKLSGKTMYGAYLALFGAALTIVLNFLLIPKMGYEGSAWATLICYASMMIVSYVIGQKNYPITYEMKKITGYISFALFIFFVSENVAFLNQLHLLANGLLMFIFIGIVWFLERKELAKLN